MLRNLFPDRKESKPKETTNQFESFNLRQFRDTLRKEIATHHDRKPVYQGLSSANMKGALSGISRFKSIDIETESPHRTLATRFQKPSLLGKQERNLSRNDSFTSKGDIYIPNFVNMDKSNLDRDYLQNNNYTKERRFNPDIKITDLGESIASNYSKYPDISKQPVLHQNNFKSNCSQFGKTGRYNSEQPTRYLSKTINYESDKIGFNPIDRVDRTLSPSKVSVNLSRSILKEDVAPKPTLNSTEDFNEKIRKVRERFQTTTETNERTSENYGSKFLRQAHTTSELPANNDIRNSRPLQKSRLEIQYSETELREMVKAFEGSSVDSIRNLPDR
jgi:hypothetical protein